MNSVEAAQLYEKILLLGITDHLIVRAWSSKQGEEVEISGSILADKIPGGIRLKREGYQPTYPFRFVNSSPFDQLRLIQFRDIVECPLEDLPIKGDRAPKDKELSRHSDIDVMNYFTLDIIKNHRLENCV
jgi:hypothetical protein